MKCEIGNRDKIIDDYVNGKLTAEEIEQFDEHCFQCDDCFHEVTFREEVSSIIKTEGPALFADYVQKPALAATGLLQKVKSFFSFFHGESSNRLGMVVVTIGTTAVLAFFLAKSLNQPEQNSRFPEQQVSVLPIDSSGISTESEIANSVPGVKDAQLAESQLPKTNIPSKPKALRDSEIDKKIDTVQSSDLAKTLAMNFEPLLYLEEMLTDISRSSAITVFTPKIGEKITDTVRFSWEYSEPEQLYLKVINNKGKELYRFEPQTKSLQFSEKLPAGLYYWKLETENDLLYVGKFLVKAGGK